MSTTKTLINRNFARASHSLPYFKPETRELIVLIPSLLSAGEPSFGVHGHLTCTKKEHEALTRHLRQKIQVPVGRLPDRILLESLIVIPRPSIVAAQNLSLAIVAVPKKKEDTPEIAKKMQMIENFLEQRGIIAISYTKRHANELLTYEIMRTGIVLAGKHPVTAPENVTDSSFFIGSLPGLIKETEVPPRKDWNPFQQYLDNVIIDHVEKAEYPSALTIEDANPFILPYLHIMHLFEETRQTEELRKIQLAIHLLFSSFAPTRTAVQKLEGRWNNVPAEKNHSLIFKEKMLIRNRLVHLEKDELPIYSWPPEKTTELNEIHLTSKGDNWFLEESRDFCHQYSWVVLAWGAISGLIGRNSRIRQLGNLGLKQDTVERLMEMVTAIEKGCDIIIPDDHLQGSIHVINNRFFFSSKPFAALENGDKHCLELNEIIKKKAILDDTDLDKFIKG